MESFIRAGDIQFPAQTQPPFFYANRAALDAAIASGNVPRDGKGRPLLRADIPRLDFWVGKPIAHGRLSRIVRKTPEDEKAQTPVGSWIAGLNELAPDDDVYTLRSDRQGVSTAEIEQLFGAQVFNFPKPSSLIRALVRATAGEGDLVLDFFAGSGTTGAAVLTLNAEDDADRRFILVSNTEATGAEPGKNLCRDVCAARLRKVIGGQGADESIPGDFAYLRTRRISWDDVIYDLDEPAIWTLLQLRHGRPLRPFNAVAALQVAPPDPTQGEEPTVAFVPDPTDAEVVELRRLASEGPVIAFTPVPGLLRDALALPAVPIEQVPNQLLAEFPRLIAGL
jgi:adenine-specific DNA-methyltransferase